MAESKSLAVENHHNSCNLGSLLLHDQLEQGEDSGEEVKERNLGGKLGNIDCSQPPGEATGQA